MHCPAVNTTEQLTALVHNTHAAAAPLLHHSTEVQEDVTGIS